MHDLLRRYVDSLAGIRELSREKAEALVGELAERGEVRARDLKKQAEDLVARSVENRKELLGLIRKEVKRQVRALGVATQDDIDRLQKRVRALEKEDDSKTSQAKKATSSSSSKKKSASSDS